MIIKFTSNSRWFKYFSAAATVFFILFSLSNRAYSTPTKGGNCAACHTNVAGSVSISGNLTTPTTLAVNPRKDSGNTGTLPCFTVTAGTATTIHITLTLTSVGVDGVTAGDNYAFSLGGTVKAGSGNNSQESLVTGSTVLGIKTAVTDKLVFSLDTTHGWTTATGTTKYYYINPTPWSGSTTSLTYDMTIGATTPADVYTMTARAGWSLNQFFGSQEFLINVVAIPEPSTIALFSGCCAFYMLRRKRR